MQPTSSFSFNLTIPNNSTGFWRNTLGIKHLIHLPSSGLLQCTSWLIPERQLSEHCRVRLERFCSKQRVVGWNQQQQRHCLSRNITSSNLPKSHFYLSCLPVLQNPSIYPIICCFSQAGWTGNRKVLFRTAQGTFEQALSFINNIFWNAYISSQPAQPAQCLEETRTQCIQLYTINNENLLSHVLLHRIWHLFLAINGKITVTNPN